MPFSIDDMSTTDQSRQERVRERLELSKDIIKDLMQVGNTPGLSVCVICDDEILFSQGFGLSDIENEIPATTSTIYPLASITKGFAAVACGILVAEGKVSWGKHFQVLSW